MTEPLNLLGKDWFTEAEAAHYCCVSIQHFRRCMPELGIHARNFEGRKVYSRSELFTAIDESPPWDIARAAALHPLPSATDAQPATSQTLLTARQVAQCAGYSRSALYGAIRAGRFPAPRKRGRQSLWVASEVHAAIATEVASLPRMERQQTAVRTGRRPDLRAGRIRPYKPRK